MAEQTVRYKSYLKTALIEGLSPVFASHPDPLLTPTKVTVDFPRTQEEYPAVVVRFFERQIMNAGVGHMEITTDDSGPLPVHYKWKHYFYNGDIELAIYALSSVDRDLVADSVVQTLTMGEMVPYTRQFLDRIYSPDAIAIPDSLSNFVNLGTDTLFGFGESQVPAPWQPEDQLVYQTSYRLPVFGEFYSLPPNTALQRVTKVAIYPYIGGLEPVPTGVSDPALWGP